MLFTLMYCRILTPIKAKSCLWGWLKHIYDDDRIKPVTIALFSFSVSLLELGWVTRRQTEDTKKETVIV